MKSRLYWLILVLILLVSFAIRILPVLDNNFHFTMDQGDDAVHVREIVERGQIQLVGPETNISGIYTGPLWYYFLAFFYIIFSGHPMFATVLLILVSLATTAVITYELSRKISPQIGLFVGAAMQINWWFYDVSRYGFNPFPLVALTIVTIFLFCHFLEKPKNQPLLIAVLVGLGFNTELAGAAALGIFSFGLMFILMIRRRLSVKHFFLSILITTLFFVPNLMYEFQNDFSGISKFRSEFLSPGGVFAENRFITVTTHYGEMIINSAIPERPILSALIWILVLAIALQRKIWRHHKYTFYFALLSGSFLIFSWLFFGSNTGWRTWHTVAVPPLLFLNLVLLALVTPKYARIVVLTVVVVFQTLFFSKLYGHFLQPTSDQSILRNEIKAIDWVYTHAAGEGFYVYNYLPSVRDYSHQYLFWWHGRKKYGYVPCEYGRFPGVPSFYVPGYKYYQKPQKPCAGIRFLIIEPDRNEAILEQWYQGVTEKTKLLEKAAVGKITVEKRLIVP